ncbi:MAG: hypothetical protein ACRCW2_05690 [Cellulosilyticaceae bacterium]
MKSQHDLDTYIQSFITQDEPLPESVKAKTQSAYEEILSMNRKRKKSNTKKWFIAAGLVAASVLTLQTPLMATIKERLFGGSYQGVESALTQGAMQYFDGIISESNGITLEAVGGFIDPTIIHLQLHLTAKDPALLKGFKYTQHSPRFVDQFNITDDQGRMLQEIDEEGESIHFISTSTESVDTRAISQGEVLIDLVLNSSAGNFGDIKGLTLQSTQLATFSGDWQLEIAFPEEDTPTAHATYELTTPNTLFTLTSAEAIKTGLKIDMIVKAPVDENVIHAVLISESGDTFTTGRAGWMESVAEGQRVVLTFEGLADEVGDSFTLQIPTLQGDDSLTFNKVSQE